jgi:lon-related putative ATP-dependent protease
VNLLVDHSASQGSPVIYEDNPTYQNLLGRIEHISVMGALVTDFTLLKPGALHRANGGYLILDAERVLQQPFTWDALKRALQSRQIRIESLGQLLSLASTVSLEPEPIPLDVKVVLLGELRLYYLLCALDPDFRELFKVQADFDDRMTRDRATEDLYASLVGTLARRHELRALDRAAVARVIEQSARLVGDAERLSAQMGEIMDLLYEADYWATRQGHEVITCADVQQAIESQRYRSDRLRESLMEETGRGMIVVETTGVAVGRVNGLSVIQLGAFAFGRPSVISARVRLGKGEVVDIEREVELGGPLHSKGVLILTGYLGTRYAAERPLSLAASVVFEQSYGGVEGDSASLAELCALLSAIAGAPLKQSLAVTGSVNQHGQVQTIGGVNEKVEGFFDLCQARGLTGEQGVIIPAANARQLMLRQEVVNAVAAGRFHLYAVGTADQALECLTGLPAGERDTSGRFPVGSFNAQIEARLAYLTDRWLEFTAEADGSRKRSLVGLS